jgi:hypothetical protein
VSAQPGSESEAVLRSATDNPGRTRLPTIAYHAGSEGGFDSGFPISFCSWKSNNLRHLRGSEMFPVAAAHQAGTPKGPFGIRRPFSTKVPSIIDP